MDGREHADGGAVDQLSLAIELEARAMADDVADDLIIEALWRGDWDAKSEEELFEALEGPQRGLAACVIEWRQYEYNARWNAGFRPIEPRWRMLPFNVSDAERGEQLKAVFRWLDEEKGRRFYANLDANWRHEPNAYVWRGPYE